MVNILILDSRRTVYQTANFAMVETYWRIGEKIVEEQSGKAYAKYGENPLKSVSKRLQAEFGKGFTYVNLTNMRNFYMQFPNIYALRKEYSPVLSQHTSNVHQLRPQMQIFFIFFIAWRENIAFARGKDRKGEKTANLGAQELRQ